MELRELIQKAYEQEESVNDLLALVARELTRHLHSAGASRVAHTLRVAVDLDGVVSDVVMRVYELLPGFEYRSEAAFFKWVRSIADNVLSEAVTRQSAQKRGGRRARVDLSRVQSHMNSSTTPGRAVRHEERDARVRQAIGKLCHPVRDAVQRVDLEQQSLDKAAEELGCSVRTLNRRLAMGRRCIRAQFGTADEILSSR